MTRTAICILSFNIPELTDNLTDAIQEQIHQPFDLFVLDNGSEPDKVARCTTHRLERNIGSFQGTNRLLQIARQESGAEFLWMLCNDIVLEKGVDTLAVLLAIFEKCRRKFGKVAMVCPSYIKKPGIPCPKYMERRTGLFGTGLFVKDFRPIVWGEWNAFLIERGFMDRFYPSGFESSGIKHAMMDIDLTYTAWKSGYGCFLTDRCAVLHLGNQTFIQHGLKEVNGVFIPDIAGLQEMLKQDFKAYAEWYRSKFGIDVLDERERMHQDIDVKGIFLHYLKRRRGTFNAISKSR